MKWGEPKKGLREQHQKCEGIGLAKKLAQFFLYSGSDGA